MNDRTHGLQFKAAFLRAAPPTTLEGIERYLGSGMIKGIGPVYARKLVQAFAEGVFDTIEQSPERLREVDGIGPKRAERIRRGWADQKVIREIMLFLHSHGVGTSRAVRIFKTYGQEAIQVISENPYRLARDIRGIGFKSADQIAMRLGIEKTAMIRARAGIGYALAEAMDEGHCGLPTDELRHLAAELLEIPPEIVDAALDLELSDGEVVADTVEGSPCVFLAGLYRAEQSIAERLCRAGCWKPALAGGGPGEGDPLGRAEGRDQPRREPEGGGTAGAAREGAGDHRRARRRQDDAGQRHPQDPPDQDPGHRPGGAYRPGGQADGRGHRARGQDPAPPAGGRSRPGRLQAERGAPARVRPAGGGRGLDGRCAADARLLKAVPRQAALILVGDVDQLPSVGPGQVLADIIGSGAVPVVRLTEVFRQAAQSRIITNAHRINQGRMPEPGDDPSSDFHLVRCHDPEDGVAKLLEIVARRIPARFGLDPIRDVQVLCPMNRGGLGARSLNLELQRLLNPPGEARVERFGWTFGPGDKVMQVVNDYEKEVFNGDLGLVRTVDAEAGELVVDFDGREVAYDFGELDELVLAYATTVHKAQGSEYPAVVIPVTTQHYPMLQRNLLYTGVTRGRKLVVLVAQPKAVAIAVKGQQERRRWSKLREWLALNRVAGEEIG